MAVWSTAHTALNATIDHTKRVRTSDRHGCWDSGPVTERMLEGDDTANCFDAVVHVGEAASTVSRSCLLGCEADAVIGHSQAREPIGCQQLDSEMTRVGMLDGVLDCLGCEEVERGLHSRR